MEIGIVIGTADDVLMKLHSMQKEYLNDLAEVCVVFTPKLASFRFSKQ
jgi:hypothetical protein